MLRYFMLGCARVRSLCQDISGDFMSCQDRSG